MQNLKAICHCGRRISRLIEKLNPTSIPDRKNVKGLQGPKIKTASAIILLGWSHTCCGESAELNDQYRLASKNATAPGLTTLAAEFIRSEAVVVTLVALVVTLVALVALVALVVAIFAAAVVYPTFVAAALEVSRLETAANVTSPAAGLTARFLSHTIVTTDLVSAPAAVVQTRIVPVPLVSQASVGAAGEVHASAHVTVHLVASPSAAKIFAEEVIVMTEPAG